MPAKWTGKVVADMHMNGISQVDVAKLCGVTPAYISMVLRRADLGTKEWEAKIKAAVEQIKASRTEE